jgi:hypothetical protein
MPAAIIPIYLRSTVQYRLGAQALKKTFMESVRLHSVIQVASIQEPTKRAHDTIVFNIAPYDNQNRLLQWLITLQIV